MVETRYRELWAELTGVEEFSGSELGRIESRVRRLNALGFDVAELDIQTSDDASHIRIQPKVVDAGHHSRRLLRLTGLDTEENQARRLLNDLDTFRVRTGQQHLDEAIVAHEWLTDVFEPVIQIVPNELKAKREPAQLFHEVLDYRWYQSQRENRDVPLTEATHGYVNDVLRKLPDEAMSADALAPVEGRHLVDPYDPSQGFIQAGDEEPPYDPLGGGRGGCRARHRRRLLRCRGASRQGGRQGGVEEGRRGPAHSGGQDPCGGRIRRLTGPRGLLGGRRFIMLSRRLAPSHGQLAMRSDNSAT